MWQVTPWTSGSLIASTTMSLPVQSVPIFPTSSARAEPAYAMQGPRINKILIIPVSFRFRTVNRTDKGSSHHLQGSFAATVEDYAC
jgi:hypothetical protein